MMPRFRTEIEKRYAKAFPKEDISNFHSVYKEDQYHELLEMAMKRESPVTLEELKAYYGEETYHKHVTYLKESGWM